MLVLTRKSQDSIRIGDHIKVTILRIKGNTVRIGVEAPEDVRIVRENCHILEISLQIHAARKSPRCVSRQRVSGMISQQTEPRLSWTWLIKEIADAGNFSTKNLYATTD